MKNFLLVLLVVAVVCLTAGFVAGWQFEKSQSPLSKLPKEAQQRFGQMGANTTGARGGNFMNRNGGGEGFVNGEILSKDNQTLTLKMRDNGSKIVFFSTSTQVSKFAPGDVSDLAVGTSVMVSGKTNSDGSITAQTIQLRSQLPGQPSQ